MNWLKELSNAHIKFATAFERIDKLSASYAKLSDELVDLNVRVARLEGAVANSTNPALMKEVLDLKEHVGNLGRSLPAVAANGEEFSGAAKTLALTAKKTKP